MRYYELMMVVTPHVDEEGLSAALDRVNRYVSERGGTVIRQRRWGNLRRLAYPINNQREGTYLLTHLELDPNDAGDLEANLRVSEDVLRHLLVKVDAIPEVEEERPRQAPVAEELPTPEEGEVARAVSEAPLAIVEGALPEAPAVEEEGAPIAEEGAVLAEGEVPPVMDVEVASVWVEAAPAIDVEVGPVGEGAPVTEVEAAPVEGEAAPAIGVEATPAVEEDEAPVAAEDVLCLWKRWLSRR